MGSRVKCVCSFISNLCVKGGISHPPPSWCSTTTLVTSLTAPIVQPSLSGRPRLVVHDMPVTLIPRRLWAVHQEPRMTDRFDASLYLPPLKLLRHVVERMKVRITGVWLANVAECVMIDTPRVTVASFLEQEGGHT